MIPEISGADCMNSVEQYTWEGFFGDAWIIIPFMLGIFVYKLFDGLNVPLQCRQMEFEEGEAAEEDEEDDEDSCKPMKKPVNHPSHRSEAIPLW